MFCGNCGEQLDDGAEFCSKCGHRIEDSMPKKKKIPTKVIAGVGTTLVAAIVAVIVIAKISVPDSKTGGISTKGMVNPAYDRGEETASTNTQNVEQSNQTVQTSEETTQGGALTKGEKDTLEALTNQWNSINLYKSDNDVRYMSGLKKIYDSYGTLSENAQKAWEYHDEFVSDYKNFASGITITNENFDEFFDIKYKVGKKEDYGEGLVFDHKTIAYKSYKYYVGGYGPSEIYEKDGEYVQTDVWSDSDIYTPIEVYISCKYPNLDFAATLDINLHQQYQGLGLVSSDLEEYKHQSAKINYHTSDGENLYLVIRVQQYESNETVGWDMFDRTHSMVPFDESRVEVKASGSINY